MLEILVFTLIKGTRPKGTWIIPQKQKILALGTGNQSKATEHGTFKGRAEATTDEPYSHFNLEYIPKYNKIYLWEILVLDLRNF